MDVQGVGDGGQSVEVAQPDAVQGQTGGIRGAGDGQRIHAGQVDRIGNAQHSKGQATQPGGTQVVRRQDIGGGIAEHHPGLINQGDRIGRHICTEGQGAGAVLHRQRVCVAHAEGAPHGAAVNTVEQGAFSDGGGAAQRQGLDVGQVQVGGCVECAPHTQRADGGGRQAAGGCSHRSAEVDRGLVLQIDVGRGHRAGEPVAAGDRRCDG